MNRYPSERVMSQPKICIFAHRSDHFTDEHGRSPPVNWGAWDQPLAVELQKKLGTRMNVHTCAVLPEGAQTVESQHLD